MTIFDDLQGQWDVNTRGRSDDTAYDHVNGLVATNDGTVTTRTGDDSQEGLVYNGSTANRTSLQFPTALSSTFANGDFTMAVRAERDVNVNGILFAFANSGASNMRLWIGIISNNDTFARAYDNNSNSQDLTEGTGTVAGTEHVIVLTRSGDDFELWRDGSSVAGPTTAAAVDNVTADACEWGVERRGVANYSFPLDGAVYWSAVWDRTLSTAEIQALDDEANPFLGLLVPEIIAMRRQVQKTPINNM